MTSLTTIDDLPPEMIDELFRHLHLKDLAACSLVNRRWHSIYAAFRLHRLVVFESFQFFGKWSYPKRRVRSVERCQPDMFNRLVEQPLLSNLKHLAISGKHPQFDADKLNRFSQLERLEIDGYLDKKKVNLKLPKLSVLAVHSWNDRVFLSVDCPKLSLLVYEEGNPEESRTLLVVKHPETIKKLVTNISNLKLRQFRNAECLVTDELERISKATLLSLPRLKELHYNSSIEKLFGKFEDVIGTPDRLKRMLIEFMDEAKVLKGSDFKFTFAGFQATKIMLGLIDFDVQIVEWDGIKHLEVSKEYIYMKNYQLLEPDVPLDFIHHVDYSSLMSNVAGEIPKWFFEKFTGIDSVSAKGVQDERHFLWFLKSTSPLGTLFFAGPPFSQEFYDHLPAIVHSLNTLILVRIVDQCLEKEFELRFDFIANLPCLAYFNADLPLSFGSLASLIRSLGKFTSGSFNFLFTRNRFRIEKNADFKFMVFHEFDNDDPKQFSRLRRPFETSHSKEVVDFFQSFQNDKSKAPRAGQVL